MKKLFLYFLLPLLLLGMAAFFFIGRYTDRLIDPYVRSLLETTKPMGHRIEYKDIRVNLLQGLILVREVRMFPDTSLGKDARRMAIYVRNIRLTGFNVREMYFDKFLNIDELLIENPDVVITLPEKIEEGIQQPVVPKTPKEGSSLLTHIHLGRIVFKGGSFQLERNDTIIANAPGINLLAESISLKENSRDEPIGFTYGNVTLSLTDIDLYSGTGLYDMSLAGFSMTKMDSTIVLNGFHMIPKYDKKEFSGKLAFQNDRFDVTIGQITLGGIGFTQFLDGEPLVISAVMIDSLHADIYRDKNVTFNFGHYPPFYNESFLKIPIPLYIDTLSITGSKINYGELAEGRPAAGSIILENFRLQTHRLTNQVAEDTIDHEMQLFVQALVMGEGALNLELTLPLEGDLHTFECIGSVGAMKLSPLNDMLEPSINMKFNGGKLNRMTFHFTANDKNSEGWMEFLYQDLEVDMLKKDSEKSRGFLSDVANWAALSNNPAPGKNLKIVEIGYDRDIHKGIINYVWKTIQSGIINTILPIKKHQINRRRHEKEKQREKDKKKKSEAKEMS
jgi:hypothetical protein